MKYTKFITYLLVALLSSFFYSCADYLDKAPEEDITMEEAFLKRNYAEAFLNRAYSAIPLENHFTDMADVNPFVLASDEITMPWPEKFGKLMNRGALNPYNATGRIWINMYEGIRQCNIFLENIHLTPTDKDFSESEKNTWIAEVTLLRALYHFYIIRTYGPCIIMDHVIKTDEKFNELRRSPLDDCIKFVLDEVNKAIPALPMKITDTSRLGHVTGALGHAIKARLLLYRASDLWNGCPLYKDYKDADGTLLFPQVREDKWWKEAANAAKECIDACEAAGYKLYRVPSDEPVENYTNLFRERDNCEVILARNCSTDPDIEKCCFPRSLGGWSGYNPTQAQVDAYEMEDGVVPILGYNPDGSPIINPASSYKETGFAESDGPNGRWKAGVSNMYTHRDPRFYATINFNGAIFKGHQIELWATGADGRGNEGRDYCTTGYLMKKHVDSFADITQGRFSLRSWILFRLGEFYLNYAEALNEAEGPIDDVHKYVNEIRARSGMPKLPDNLTKDQMRERIRRERQVELAYETHRYFDCHRWLIAEKTESGPVYGMNIAAGTHLQDPAFYERTIVETRIFQYPQYYLFPIMQAEIDKMDALMQNPYW